MATTLDPWISPQKLTDLSTLVLVADFNMWTTESGGSAYVPHAANGALLGSPDPANGTRPLRPINGSPPLYLGAKGGNVGLLDGSARWKKIQAMGTYQLWSNGSGYNGNW